jgi:hypothetical protein
VGWDSGEGEGEDVGGDRMWEGMERMSKATWRFSFLSFPSFSGLTLGQESGTEGGANKRTFAC